MKRFLPFLAHFGYQMPLEKNGCTVYSYCVCPMYCTIQGCKVGPSGLGIGHRSGVHTFTYRYVLVPKESIRNSRSFLFWKTSRFVYILYSE